MASQYVLDISELLGRIIELADGRTQVAAASTCRSWSEHALRSIWVKLPSFVPLLELLAPLRERHDGVRGSYWEFGRDIRFEDWQRLEFYGKNVRSINHSDEKGIKDGGCTFLEITYLKLAAASANRPTFLPNLRKLEWTISQSSSLAAIGTMVGPNLTELIMDVRSHIDVSQIFNNLRGRVRHLENFCVILSFDVSVESVEKSLTELVVELSELSTLHLPPYFLSARVVTALTSLSRLRQLKQTDRGNYTAPYNANGCKLRFDNECFSNLTSLAYDSDLWVANDNFRSTMAPHRLTSLYIGARDLRETADLRKFLETLVSTTPLLTTLSLNLYTFGSASDVEPLALDDLAVVLQLNLTGFTITHDRPLQYSDENIVAMGDAWPKLDYLSLNDEPLIHDGGSPTPGLDLTHLSVFPSHFPFLVTLGIYLRVEEDFKASQNHPSTRFHKLERFRVGSSSRGAANSEEISSFLALLMPNAAVTIDIQYSSWYPRPDDLDDDVTNSGWEDVCKYFPVCFKAQESLRQELEKREKRFVKLRSTEAGLDQLATENAYQAKIEELQLEHNVYVSRMEKEKDEMQEYFGRMEKQLQEEISRLSDLQGVRTVE